MEKIVFLEYTQNRLNLNYDQRRWLPRSREIVARYEPKSQEARSRVSRTTFQYGKSDEETLDWFPSARASAPTMIFIHGAAWLNFTKDDFYFVAAALLRQSFNACVLNFASLKTVRMPEMCDQVRRAIAWVATNAAKLGADPFQLHFCGHSSGAHLVAVSLTSDWTAFGLPDGYPILSASCISGVFDLEPVMLSARRNYISLDATKIDALSPIRHVADIRCHVLVSESGQDTSEFQRHSREFANALEPEWRPGCLCVSRE